MRTATEVQREAGQPPGVAHQPVGRHYGQGVGLGVGIHPDDEIKALCDDSHAASTSSSRFGVVTASAREEAVVGRNCKGSPPGGYRAGHASDQATATRPGPAPVPTTSTCGHIPRKTPRDRGSVSFLSASTRGATEADRGWRHLRLRFVRLDCVLGVAEPRQREQLPTGLIYLDKFRGARSRPCLRAAHDSSSVSIPTTSERPDNADTNGVNGPLPTSWRSTSTTASGRRGSSTENSCTAKPLPVHSAITRRSTPAPSRYRTRTATRPP